MGRGEGGGGGTGEGRGKPWKMRGERVIKA